MRRPGPTADTFGKYLDPGFIEQRFYSETVMLLNNTKEESVGNAKIDAKYNLLQCPTEVSLNTLFAEWQKHSLTTFRHSEFLGPRPTGTVAKSFKQKYRKREKDGGRERERWYLYCLFKSKDIRGESGVDESETF